VVAHSVGQEEKVEALPRSGPGDPTKALHVFLLPFIPFSNSKKPSATKQLLNCFKLNSSPCNGKALRRRRCCKANRAVTEPQPVPEVMWVKLRAALACPVL
jgi:hypothetical protein